MMNTMMMTVACLLAAGLVSLLGPVGPAQAEEAGDETTKPTSVHDFKVTDIRMEETDLAAYRGKVMLIVNTASKCGLTPQYDALQKLYEAQRDQGLVIIGFPSNNFGKQEPGSEEEIAEFCRVNYGVTFPMMSKISVKGDDKHPLYRYLTEEETAGEFAGEIGWNFTKFLIGPDGRILARFDSKTKPDDPKLVEAVEQALASASE